MKYLFMVVLILMFTGCLSKNIKVKKDIEDLKNIPQDVRFYTKNIDVNVSNQDIRQRYEKLYFRVWNIDTPPEKVQNIQWPFRAYTIHNSYGENFQPLNQSFFDKMYENSNFNAYGTLNKKAIALGHLNMRGFPTVQPLIKDPSIAGEGFPFDYLQNSTVSANKPLFVSHYSIDGEWVYVFSSFTSGWVKSNEIAFLDKQYTDLWQQAKQVLITKENISLFSNEGNFLFKSKIGMMLPLIDENDNDYTVLTITAYKNSQPIYLQTSVSKKIASKEILTFSKDNIDNIISEIAASNYGWGGMYNQRDCSSTLRDQFAVFGIWLPRNSSQQSRVGKVVSLENLTDEEKINLIKKEAIPFQTLLYKRGHIVLYVGTYEDQIIIFHNAWGIKTKKDGVKGRVVVGKSIFSTLKLGKEQEDYDEDGEILRNLKSMNILTGNH